MNFNICVPARNHYNNNQDNEYFHQKELMKLNV